MTSLKPFIKAGTAIGRLVYYASDPELLGMVMQIDDKEDVRAYVSWAFKTPVTTWHLASSLTDFQSEIDRLETKLTHKRMLKLNARKALHCAMPGPPMVCGTCGGKLIDPKGNRNYTHEGAMMDRHGAYPVEEWDGE